MISCSLPIRHQKLNQCCVDVGPASTTLAQHQNSIGSTSAVTLAPPPLPQLHPRTLAKPLSLPGLCMLLIFNAPILERAVFGAASVWGLGSSMRGTGSDSGNILVCGAYCKLLQYRNFCIAQCDRQHAHSMHLKSLKAAHAQLEYSVDTECILL